MAIVSVGYDGSVDEQDWANLARCLGKDPWCIGWDAWRVTSVTGPDRTVRVATGTGYGWGVKDDSDTSVDLQLSTVASGSRWDTVVARRDWQPTPGGGTTFRVVQGTSTLALAASLLNTPGVQADQALALVQVTAGVSTPTAVIDLRKDGNGGVHSQDAAALVGGRMLDVGWSPFLLWSTHVAGHISPEWQVRNGQFRLRGDITPKVGSPWVGPGDKGIGTVPIGFEPPKAWRGAVALLGLSPADFAVTRAIVYEAGNMEMYVPNGFSVTGVCFDTISYSLEA